MRRKWRTLGTVLAVALAGGAIFAYVNWHNRYVWPRKHREWLLDLPPLDASALPKNPPPWKIETNLVEVATPTGLKPTNITYYVNSLGMKFVRITPGTFWEGLTKEQAMRLNAGKKLGHQVTLTKPYYLAAYEVTNEQFEQFDPAHAKHRAKYQRGEDGGQHPIEPIKWRPAQEFCRWLTQKEGRIYRLPTEAEWEYACKAGTTNILYWGDQSWDRLKANVGGLRSVPETYYEDGYGFTSPVGVYPPNPWGLYDMVGNVWEWVEDWFDWYPSESQVDPKGPPTGHIRVKKGASWSTRTRDLKSCARDGNNPADLFEIEGFRVLCEVSENER
jgi:formylglycine-generating enzyme required for sulfatase activity